MSMEADNVEEMRAELEAMRQQMKDLLERREAACCLCTSDGCGAERTKTAQLFEIWSRPCKRLGRGCACHDQRTADGRKRNDRLPDIPGRGRQPGETRRTVVILSSSATEGRVVEEVKKWC